MQLSRGFLPLLGWQARTAHNKQVWPGWPAPHTATPTDVRWWCVLVAGTTDEHNGERRAVPCALGGRPSRSRGRLGRLGAGDGGA